MLTIYGHTSTTDNPYVKSQKSHWQYLNSRCVNLPAEGTNRQVFGSFVPKIPQRHQGSLMAYKLIRGIFIEFKIYKGIKVKKKEKKNLCLP